MPFDGKIADYKTNTVADVLRRAKALIANETDWAQGIWGRTLPLRGSFSDGQHCVRTAIFYVDPWAQQHTAERVFMRANGISECSMAIPMWNNADERTHADVMAAFDRAIALAESE